MRRKHKNGHLYRFGAEGSEKRSFEHRYGKNKGAYVYGATVGKVKRERLKKNRGN